MKADYKKKICCKENTDGGLQPKPLWYKQKITEI
jgi:hypothetical protein